MGIIDSLQFFWGSLELGSPGPDLAKLAFGPCCVRLLVAPSHFLAPGQKREADIWLAAF